MSEAVHDMFATIARRYDLANRVLSCGRDLAWRKAALALFDPVPDRCLDLACGTFDLGIDALARLPTRRVIGADFCLPMLQAGKGKITGKAIEAINTDALALPFADNSFDGAMMAYGWRNVDDPTRSLAELFRVLCPGGQLLILEFFKPTSNWPKFFYGTFGRFVFPVVGGLLTGDSTAYRYLNDSIKRFVSIDEAEDLFRQTGFRDIRRLTCFGGVSHGICARTPTDA